MGGDAVFDGSVDQENCKGGKTEEEGGGETLKGGSVCAAVSRPCRNPGTGVVKFWASLLAIKRL